MCKFFKNEKAGSNAITFVLIFAVIVYILISSMEPITLGFNEWALSTAYKKGLDKMQQKGGLTPDIEQDIKRYLGKLGFDESKIVVDGTIAPVNWGDDVALEIQYPKEYTVYAMEKFIMLKKEVKTVDLKINGSTSSYFVNN